jgi:hypothetical protein
MWILCDNKSIVDIFKNKDFITNIRQAENPIKLKGIEGGLTIVDKEGDLLGYGKFNYHPRITATVLSSYNIAKHFKSIKYDNEVKDAFRTTHHDGFITEFKPSDGGLYYYNFKESKQQKYKNKNSKERTWQ